MFVDTRGNEVVDAGVFVGGAPQTNGADADFGRPAASAHDTRVAVVADADDGARVAMRRPRDLPSGPTPAFPGVAARRPKENTMRKFVTRILPAFLAVAGLLAALPACPPAAEGEGEGESA
jgi:hypothetical protein